MFAVGGANNCPNVTLTAHNVTRATLLQHQGGGGALENALPSRAAIFLFSHAPLTLCPWRGSVGSVAHRDLEQNVPEPDA